MIKIPLKVEDTVGVQIAVAVALLEEITVAFNWQLIRAGINIKYKSQVGR
jgi:hypothetical protein